MFTLKVQIFLGRWLIDEVEEQGGRMGNPVFDEGVHHQLTKELSVPQLLAIGTTIP